MRAVEHATLLVLELGQHPVEILALLRRRLEASGDLLRIDPRVRPTVYRCATISQAELALLWQIFAIDRRNWIPESDFQ